MADPFRVRDDQIPGNLDSLGGNLSWSLHENQKMERPGNEKADDAASAQRRKTEYTYHRITQQATAGYKGVQII